VKRNRRRARPTTRASEPEFLGVDTGGTFTDFVARRGGRWIALKVPSTPKAPERAVLEGLGRLGAGSRTRVRHGSTVATNTLLERKGARVTLVTTAGFEDVLEIGRQDRPDLYALQPRRVPPLVPAERRLGVRERLDPRGRARIPLAASEVRRAATRVEATRPEAVAVGLLHAYAGDRHERLLTRALRARGLLVTGSAELCPEFREYERLATTVTNAYLLPRMGRYLDAVSRGVAGELEVVLSHGGTAPPGEAAREPVRQLLSGPAGGLAAAAAVARACAFPRAMTLDVGGTSTDVAFVEGDELPRRRGREVAGFPVLLPMLDVHTVGAGGGSIADVDAGGLPHVGPESAGAEPGPACYGRGGPATVTDALLVLGRIPLASLGDGSLALDRAAAAAAVSRFGARIRRPRLEQAAEAIVALAEARMSAALRAVTVQRGHDPRGAALVAFGGAGGLHACALAESLECDAVIFPAHAGVLSALGALAGGSRRERSRSVLLDARDSGSIARALALLSRAVLAELPRRERSRARVTRWAEVRYRGQSHELALPATAALAERFHEAHARRFGFASPHLPVEVVTLEARAATPAFGGPRAAAGASRAPRSSATGRARTRAWTGKGWREVPVVEFDAPGGRIAGPCVVLQSGATLWVPDDWSGTRHASGALVLRRGRR
jgi:N-methylhydantoinase A